MSERDRRASVATSCSETVRDAYQMYCRVMLRMMHVNIKEGEDKHAAVKAAPFRRPSS